MITKSKKVAMVDHFKPVMKSTASLMAEPFLSANTPADSSMPLAIRRPAADLCFRPPLCYHEIRAPTALRNRCATVRYAQTSPSILQAHSKRRRFNNIYLTLTVAIKCTDRHRMHFLHLMAI